MGSSAIMATKVAAVGGPHAMGAAGHTAGIFADMTVDGPEIGTLVLVVDRAKNLPNRKTMGKQNPYCAARLGKEAKKTETDKRGGQTPKWDQELRFIVHDSPDYNNLKISVFSEDKRTDLIGEAWVGLTDVVIPGGGKNDLWQGLNCKGKYAGEIRLEVTYYDTRPKPEKEDLEDAIGQGTGSTSRVKRRPLPTNPNGPRGLTPDTIPGLSTPGRAKHGPRDYRTPPSRGSMPQEPITSAHPAQASSVYGMHAPAHGHPYALSAPDQIDQKPEEQATYDQFPHSPHEYAPETPGFLPQLPPSSRQRTATQHQQRYVTEPESTPMLQQHHHHQPPATLVHSHSAPIVPPTQHDHFDHHYQSQLHTEPPEPLIDIERQHQHLRQRSQDALHQWTNQYEEPQYYRRPYVEDEDGAPPPPPPVHSNSAPAVPQYEPGIDHSYSSPASRYGATPPDSRQRYVTNQSPLQTIERDYAPAQHTPTHGHPERGRSVDEYGSSPGYSGQGSLPASLTPSQKPALHSRPSPGGHPHRHNVADPPYATPPRPHPLSQEVSRARSPQPHREPQYASQTPPNHGGYQYEQRSRDAIPIIKPRAVSPAPMQAVPPATKSRSPYSIQHPIRAFESSDESPLSTSQRQPIVAKVVDRSTPMRKSVSPRPSLPNGAALSSVPFSPDSFDVHNPHSRSGSMPANSSPHTPYHQRQVTDRSQQEQRSGPILGWDGREIDPSDHLPVDSWAPEPEQKNPMRTYGLGRDRDFGPRSRDATSGGSPGAGHRLSKDTVVNIRSKATPDSETPSRSRLQKKGPNTAGLEPLRERHNFNNPVPNPYAQREFSPAFPGEQRAQYHDAPHVLQAERGYGLPALPPKVPLQHQQQQYQNYDYDYDYDHHYSSPAPYGPDALSREISSIDIGSSSSRQHSRQGGGSTPIYGTPGGGGSGGSAGPSPGANFVPVRSHKDRNTVYH